MGAILRHIGTSLAVTRVAVFTGAGVAARGVFADSAAMAINSRLVAFVDIDANVWT